MLSAIVFALSLDGLLPGAVIPRRPAPVIRYDRIREPRPLRNLREIAERLAHGGEPAAPARDATARLEEVGTRTATGSTGWLSVFFTFSRFR
jgi:hypothetical protein